MPLPVWVGLVKVDIRVARRVCPPLPLVTVGISRRGRCRDQIPGDILGRSLEAAQGGVDGLRGEDSGGGVGGCVGVAQGVWRRRRRGQRRGRRARVEGAWKKQNSKIYKLSILV